MYGVDPFIHTVCVQAERTGKKLPTPKQKKEKTLPSAPSNGGANKSAANAAPATSKRPKSHSHNASFLSSLSDTLAAAKEISSETPKVSHAAGTKALFASKAHSMAHSKRTIRPLIAHCNRLKTRFARPISPLVPPLSSHRLPP